MITYHYENTLPPLENESIVSKWIENIIFAGGFEIGEVNYIFCDDS